MGKSVIIFSLFATLVILFGGIVLLSGSAIKPSNNIQLTIPQKDFDFGTVKMTAGNVIQKYIIKNSGKDILKLTNIKTSCHCTKAFVTIADKQSPSFGMSGVSSWIGEVQPGKTAELTVIFDPAFHGPNGVGQITRYISAETNDAGNPKLTFTLRGFVIQ